jgi:hypothetical protein
MQSVSQILESRLAAPQAQPFRRALVAAASLHLALLLAAWILPRFLATPQPPIEYVAVRIVPAVRLGVEQPRPAPPRPAETRPPQEVPRPERTPPAAAAHAGADEGRTSAASAGRQPSRRGSRCAGRGAGDPGLPAGIGLRALLRGRPGRDLLRQPRFHLWLLRRPDAGADLAALDPSAGGLWGRDHDPLPDRCAMAVSPTCASSVRRGSTASTSRRCAPSRRRRRSLRCRVPSARIRSAST